MRTIQSGRGFRAGLRFFSCASASALALALSGQAMAQTAAPTETAPASTAPAPAAPAKATGLEDIIVTAQKRSENVQAVPLSIVSISGAALKDNLITNPLDIGKLAPSLKVFNSTISTGIQIRIRGFGAATNSSTDSDVASYMDGAFIPRPAAILGSFLDVGNIEVLSGPQGTLFGRNAAMGAVSINTNAPTWKSSLDASFEGGSYGTYKGTVVANLPVTDTFALRGAFQVSHTDGVFHNNFDNKDYGAGTTYVGRVSAKWKIAPNLTWVFRADGSKTDGDGANTIAVYTNTATAAQLAALSNFAINLGGSAPVLSSNPSYTVNQRVGDVYNHDRQFGFTSDLSWNVGSDLTVRLIDTYRDWSNKSKYPDAPATTIDLLSARQNTASQSTTHELQLVSPKNAFLDGKLGITTGLYYFHEKYDIDVYFDLGTKFCGVLFGAVAPPLVAPCMAGPQVGASFSQFTQKTDSYAAYAQVNYSILPTVELDLGGRQTWEKKTGSLTQFANNPIAIGRLAAAEGPDPLYFTDNNFSMRASLSWHITPDVMTFATYSTGFKAGGFNAGAAGVPLGSAKRTFASETVKDVELGFKSSFFDHKLIFNTTFFYTKLFNFQDRSFDGFAFLVRNAGDVRSQGVDINGRFRAFPRLTFDYGATYLDSIYAKNTAAPGLEGCAAIPGTNTPANPACPLTQDLSGATLPYAPKWQGHLGANWKIGSVKGFAIDANASENFSTSFQTSTTNNPQAIVPGFATTDLRIGVASPDGRWKLDVFGSNIFDKHYYVATVAQVLGNIMPGVNNTATGSTVFRGFLGDPARYGVRISASF